MFAMVNSFSKWGVYLLLAGMLSFPALDVSAEEEQDVNKNPENRVSDNSEPATASRTRRKPGKQKEISPYDVIPQPDLNNSGVQRTTPLGRVELGDEYLPIQDRWRLANAIGKKESYLDPYNRNLLKADRPIWNDWFFNLSLISDTFMEYRQIPTPVGPQSSRFPDSNNVLGGRRNQFTFIENIIVGLVLYKGDTVFRPPDYEFRFTPVFNYNYNSVRENRVLHIDPADGNTRSDGFVGIQDLFFDMHLRNVSDRYDFDSIRVGIQPFSTDFRGFLFQDNQFGVRLFGNRDNNFWQYNLAWFRRLEKDTNSGLNDLSEGLRDDDVFIANIYRQDFPVKGFVSQLTTIYNRNREADNELFFDKNGFLVRPASLGNEFGRDYDAYYIGYNGDGHFGRLNLTLSAYYVFGDESNGVFASAADDEFENFDFDNPGKGSDGLDIDAFFFASEVSMDFDWLRLRLSGLYASGDDDPFDSDSQGFDAIFENPVFAGADTSFWIRQAVPLVGGGGVTLSGRNAILNSLRSSKDQGQSNFTNPGTILLGVGVDADILPELRLSSNINHLWFDNTATLEAARNQGQIDDDIGWDISVTATYRPFMTQNLIFQLSGAVLVPGRGYEDLFGDSLNYSVLGNLVFTY